VLDPCPDQNGVEVHGFDKSLHARSSHETLRMGTHMHAKLVIAEWLTVSSYFPRLIHAPLLGLWVLTHPEHLQDGVSRGYTFGVANFPSGACINWKYEGFSACTLLHRPSSRGVFPLGRIKQYISPTSRMFTIPETALAVGLQQY